MCSPRLETRRPETSPCARPREEARARSRATEPRGRSGTARVRLRSRRSSAASDDSRGHAENGRQQQRRRAEERRLARALGDEAADRPAVFEGLPQVEPGGAPEPVAIADEERPIESEGGGGGVDRGEGGNRGRAGGVLPPRRREECRIRRNSRRARPRRAAATRTRRPPRGVPRAAAGEPGTSGSRGARRSFRLENPSVLWTRCGRGAPLPFAKASADRRSFSESAPAELQS